MLDIWGPTQSQHMIIVNLRGRVYRFCPPGFQIHSFSLLRRTKIMDFEQSLHTVNTHKHWVSWSQKLSQHLFSQIHTYPKHTPNGLSHFLANLTHHLALSVSWINFYADCDSPYGCRRRAGLPYGCRAPNLQLAKQGVGWGGGRGRPHCSEDLPTSQLLYHQHS